MAQCKTAPKQCEYDIALELKSHLRISFVIGQIVCYIYVLRILLEPDVAMWSKIKTILILDLELGFL